MAENGSCSDLQYATKMLLRELLIEFEKGLSKTIGQRPNVIQRLQTDLGYLKQRLYYQRPSNGNFERHIKYFFGIGDLVEELYELMFNILLQFKLIGAQEDQLRHTLQLDLRSMNKAIADGHTLSIQDLDTFRMTDGGNPVRYCTMWQ